MILVDLDVLAYRAAFACEKTQYIVANAGSYTQHQDAKEAKAAADQGGGSIWSRKEVEPADKAVEIARIMYADIKARFPGMKARGFLTGVGNFRYAIATRKSYKSSRREGPKHLHAVQQMLIEGGAHVSAGQEADDSIALAWSSDPDAVICSVDKDLRMLHGEHYDFVKKESTRITVREGWLNFWQQCITGDDTDSIPGIHGIGPVKARKELAGVSSNKECWKLVNRLYEKAYGDKGASYALECARLVWLRRKEGEIWEPADYDC